jgi:quercetin dioxygenase-like cupin family protein
VSAFEELGDLRPLPIWDGILARAVVGEEMTMAIVELDPNAVAAEHHHANEQLGIVLSGTMTFRIGDETREIGPGMTYRILADVPHTATAGPDGCVVMDIFAPPRHDWDAHEPGAPKTPRWP